MRGKERRERQGSPRVCSPGGGAGGGRVRGARGCRRSRSRSRRSGTGEAMVVPPCGSDSRRPGGRRGGRSCEGRSGARRRGEWSRCSGTGAGRVVRSGGRGCRRCGRRSRRSMGMVVPSGGRGSRRGHGRRWRQGGAGAGEVAPERALQSRRVVVGVGGEKAATAVKLMTGTRGCPGGGAGGGRVKGARGPGGEENGAGAAEPARAR